MGVLIMGIGGGMFFPKAGLVGAILAILMIVGILSFLATTPEAWVSDLGAERGFSLLSGARRLVVKDIAILVGCRSCSPNRGISEHSIGKMFVYYRSDVYFYDD